MMAAGKRSSHSNNSALKSKKYNLDSHTANILSYANALPNESFTVMKYTGYSEGGAINAAPTNCNGIAYIAKNSSDYITIIAVPYNNAGLYTQSKDSGAWSGWKSS